MWSFTSTVDGVRSCSLLHNHREANWSLIYLRRSSAKPPNHGEVIHTLPKNFTVETRITSIDIFFVNKLCPLCESILEFQLIKDILSLHVLYFVCLMCIGLGFKRYYKVNLIK